MKKANRDASLVELAVADPVVSFNDSFCWLASRLNKAHDFGLVLQEE
jgi:hypothetical protein